MEQQHPENQSGPTRRKFLQMLGLGGAAIAGGCVSNGGSPYAERMLPNPFQGKGIIINPGSSVKASPPPAQAMPAEPNMPGIIPRSAWAKEGPNLRTIEPMGGVDKITFHHSGDPQPFYTDDYKGTAEFLERVRHYHREVEGWQDIGYHYGIDRAGRVWQLRSTRYEGQHVHDHNAHNVGVVVLGNFDKQKMTSQQQARVQSFGLWLRRQYKLSIPRVYTHQELRPTECPGDHMQPFMVQIRRKGLI